MTRKQIKTAYGGMYKGNRDLISNDGWKLVGYGSDIYGEIARFGFTNDQVEIKTIPGCMTWRPKTLSSP